RAAEATSATGLRVAINGVVDHAIGATSAAIVAAAGGRHDRGVATTARRGLALTGSRARHQATTLRGARVAAGSAFGRAKAAARRIGSGVTSTGMFGLRVPRGPAA